MSQKILKIRSASGDIRRVALTSWPDLRGLDTTLRNLFGAELPQPYTLRYTDPDGDQISITSNLELQEAIDAARGNMLSLSVSPAVSAASSVTFSSTSAFVPSPSPVPSPFSFGSPSVTSSARPSSSPHAVRFGMDPPPLPGSFSFGVDSVTTSQAADTLFIDEHAPPSFTRDLRTLLSQFPFHGWEQVRDTLIDFGGDVSKVPPVLGVTPRKSSPPTSRHYFSISFARSACELQAAGFPLKGAIAALIRNGGVAANAALELSGAASDERCPSGHLLEVSSFNLGEYATGWYCNRCKSRSQPGQRWFCTSCQYDVCFKCLPKPTALVPPSLAPKPVPVPLVSDASLPASLLQPVQMLEAMGFTDRMRVIEALVQNSGDIVKCATQLAEERRREEEKEALIKRREEKRRRQEEARKQRERQLEEQRRLAAQRAEKERLEAERLRAQREVEARRAAAAKIITTHPEKYGSDLAQLMGMGFDPISSTTSLVDAGGDFQAALDELLRLQAQGR